MKFSVVLVSLLLSLIILFFPDQLTAQQQYMVSQYNTNKLLHNPAYSGNKAGLNIDILSRFQWVGIEGSPITQGLALNGSVANRPNRNVGLGLVVLYDRLAITSNVIALSTYSYRIITPTGLRVSFGLQAGINKYQAVNSRLVPTNSSDPNITQEDVNSIIPQAGVGIYMNNKNFFFGFSVPNVIPNSSLDGDGSLAKYHANLMLGYNGRISKQKNRIETGYFRLHPSMIVRYGQGSPLIVDLNTSFEFFEQFSVGIGYRSISALILTSGLRISNSVSVGYAYDFPIISTLRTFHNGSHEFTVSIHFIDENKPEVRRLINSRGVYHDEN